VYYLDGVFYSWGKQFASIAQMPNNYEGICYQITFEGLWRRRGIDYDESDPAMSSRAANPLLPIAST
jgi:hypothetical protein